MSLFKSLNLATSLDGSAQVGAALCGFQCGNRYQPGCLTSDLKIRLHSCERELDCPDLKSPDIVWITPILKFSNGEVVPELGAGGGLGDLAQAQELELKDANTAIELMDICSTNIRDEQALARTLSLISKGMKSANKTVVLGALEEARESDAIPLKELAKFFSRGISYENRINSQKYSAPSGDTVANQVRERDGHPGKLPNIIVSGNILVRLAGLREVQQFPYSRHSSYNELCHLVEVFRPVDIHPCTVEEATWIWDFSMESLFGHLCSGTVFAHDKEMISLESQRAELQTSKRERAEDHESSEDTQKSQDLVSQDQDMGSSTERTGRPASLNQSQKRWRASPVTSEDCSEKSLVTMASRPKSTSVFGQRINRIRSSFQDWVDLAADFSQSPSPTPSPVSDKTERQSRDPTELIFDPALTKSTPKPEVAISILGTSPIARIGEASTDPASEEFRYTGRKSPLGGLILPLTRSGAPEPPIELSDDLESVSEVQNASFVTVPEIQSSPVEKDPSSGSQTSLDDSIFESEESCYGSPESKSQKTKRRKEAYRAALGQNGLSWDNDCMISSHGGHAIPEVEL